MPFLKPGISLVPGFYIFTRPLYFFVLQQLQSSTLLQLLNSHIVNFM